MNKDEIQRIYTELIKNYWGDIDPAWFEFIEFIEFPVNETEYNSDHINFQKILQNVKGI